MKKIILLCLISSQFYQVYAQDNQKEFIPRILIGVSAMNTGVSGDVRSKNAFGEKMSFGLVGKLQFSKHFSSGIEINRGSTVGENTQGSIGYQFATNNTNPWKNLGYTTAVYYNYKMSFTKAGLNFGASTNTDKRISFGIQPSIGILNFKTKVNALNASQQLYDFSKFNSNNWNDSYESIAENESNSVMELLVDIGPTINVGKGLYVSLNLSIGFTNSDLLDGNQWQERDAVTFDKDNMFYTGLRVFYDFNLLSSK